ncbi:hypothetical protein GDO81_022480 [Engystomops pustulosus]|uniref:Uncharacterized protein n=1 Tax=Engystomops pustulosus TaxID=76066 RepID=A0AAV6YXP6_ENGPU|nr:hypothetical protein GDO81_022480 [Engystomops pustulosus]
MQMFVFMKYFITDLLSFPYKVDVHQEATAIIPTLQFHLKIQDGKRCVQMVRPVSRKASNFYTPCSCSIVPFPLYRELTH